MLVRDRIESKIERMLMLREVISVFVDDNFPGTKAFGIFNLVRGLTRPYPGAIMEWDGRTLRVWKVRILEESGRGPGIVEAMDSRNRPRIVGTAGGKIEIVESECAEIDIP